MRKPPVWADYHRNDLRLGDDRIMVVVRGRTFPIKEKLKAAGFRWDPIAKRWYLLTNMRVKDRISPWSNELVIEKLKAAGVEHLIVKLPEDKKLIEKAGLKPVDPYEVI